MHLPLPLSLRAVNTVVGPQSSRWQGRKCAASSGSPAAELKCKVQCGLCVVGMSLYLGLWLWPLQNSVHCSHALGAACLPQNSLGAA